MQPTFRSFLQAGFECSVHKLKSGKRLDLIRSTEHDRFLREDYRRLAEFGIRTVREGLRWTVIEETPGRLDFSSVEPFLAAAEEQGIEIIWDLLHFGWPDYLDIFRDEWVEAFGALAGAFARFLGPRAKSAPFIAPVNEISFLSWGGGDVAYLNPFRREHGAELKRQLVRGAVAAVRAVRNVIPDAIMVSPEPVIHIVGDPAVPGDVEQAEAYRRSMFEAWDMLMGRAQPELGGSERCVDVIGVNFYDRNQWRNFGKTLHRAEPEYRPFREILKEVWDRYRRPVFVSETGTENEGRPDWFAYIDDEVRAAVEMDVPMQGICLYPILNHPGWDDDRHCHNGLWDYASESGNREIYEPLAEELRKRHSNATTRELYGHSTDDEQS